MSNRGLLLVDGNGLGWWCVMRRGSGGPIETKVLFGATSILMEAQHQLGDYDVVIIFDGGRSEYRTALFPGYKAKRRSEHRTEVLTSLIHAQQALDKLGANHLMVPGVEGDDLISIMATYGQQVSRPVVIWSDDKDLYQCLGRGVVQYQPSKRRTVKAEEALAEWGTRDRFLLWKALAGDSGDGVPGLVGIGEQRAHELVALCRGRRDDLFTDRMKRMLEDKSWASVLWRPETPQHLAVQKALVTTATSPIDLGERSDDVIAAVARVIHQQKEPAVVTEDQWLDFVREYDGFHLISSRSAIERLYNLRIGMHEVPAARDAAQCGPGGLPGSPEPDVHR